MDVGVESDFISRPAHSDDHDILIEMRADLRHLRARFDELVGTVARLDRDAVTHSALQRALATLTGIVVAIAAGLGIWLHK